jgi:hypothetical protein
LIDAFLIFENLLEKWDFLGEDLKRAGVIDGNLISEIFMIHI